MFRLSEFVRKQGEYLLVNRQHAMLQVAILALLPFTAWLSVAVIALVTLRKGWRDGALLLVVAASAYFVLLLAAMTTPMAVCNEILIFVSCYIAACVLRVTASWRLVSGIFFLQAVLVVSLLQTFAPDFITAQFLFLQNIVNELQNNTALTALVNNKTELEQVAFANYLLGIQFAGMVLSAIVSLMLARSLQSRLYYPGGFKEEMLAFRADRLSLLMLIITSITAYQHNVLAMCVLPVLILYFLAAGLSLGFNILAKKNSLLSLIFLITPLLLMPMIMLPAYVILGSLDSLFNFRLYLLSSAGKTT